MSKPTRHRHDTAAYSEKWRLYVHEQWSLAEEVFEENWRRNVAGLFGDDCLPNEVLREGLVEACEQLLIRYWDDMQLMVRTIRGRELKDSEVTTSLLWEIFQGLEQICFAKTPIRATVRRIWFNIIIREVVGTDNLDDPPV